MSPRDWQTRITDILACIRNIESFITGMDYFTFTADPKTVRAVAFELVTIGEAVRAIDPEVRANNPQVPWAQMLAIRNTLVHAYFRLDEEIIWQTCREDIPKLTNVLNELIKTS